MKYDKEEEDLLTFRARLGSFNDHEKRPEEEREYNSLFQHPIPNKLVHMTL